MKSAFPTPPEVSVIVPTWNRRELLREVLESLFHQTLDPSRYEILVIDNCSADGTADMVAGLQSIGPCDLHYHRMDENRGPSRSRNLGARLARAEVLAFTDSDCRVAPEWLERGLRPFLEDPGVTFVSGPILDKPGQPVRFFSLGGAGLPGEDPIYPTANVFYRKQALLENGGFDEGLYEGDRGKVPVECADVEMAWRLKEMGLRNVFVPDLLVYHEVTQASPWQWIMVNARLVQIPLMVRRHPGLRPVMIRWRWFSLMSEPTFYLGLAGLLLVPLISPWAALLVVPYVVRASAVPGRRFSLSDLPAAAGRVFFLAVRHAFVCAFLLYGSVRARRLVL